MASVRPFRALRVHPDRAELSRVIAPSSAHIDDERRALLHDREPRNVARVVAQARGDEDTSETTSRRAAFHLAEWRRAGVLAFDDYASFYGLRHTFASVEGEDPKAVEGFFAAVDLGDEDVDGVLPCELSDPGEVDALTHHLRTLGHQAEPVQLVHRDEKGRVQRAIASEMEERDPDARAELDGCVYELWVIDDETTTARVSALLGEEKLYLVDGHARFAAAAALERSLAGNPPVGLAQASERQGTSVLALVTSESGARGGMEATHRVASWMGTRDLAELLGEMQRWFRRTAMSPGEELAAALDASTAEVAFGMWLRGEGCWLFELLDDVTRDELPGIAEGAPRVDATVVDEMVLKQLLGVDPESGDVRYVNGLGVADRMADDVDNDVVFLLRAPELSALLEAADGGQQLPAHCTSFYPKPPCGLVFSPLVARHDDDG